jgi:Ca-activated chloride channel homolog
MQHRVYSRMLGSLVLCALVGIGATQAAQQNPRATSPDGSYTISVSIDWVVLPVTVLDGKSRSVPTLDRNRFKIYEDGRIQEIRLFKHEEVSLTLGLVIDNSESMRGKRSEATAAALALVGSLNPADEVFVVNFNDRAELGLQADQGFTNNLDQVRLALNRQVSGGGTALHDAIGLALDQLKQGHEVKKVLLLISDGGDSASHLQLEQVLQRTKESRATIYAISLLDPRSQEQETKVLNQIAKISGGEVFFPSSLQEVRTIAQKISQDIRSQYTLGYIPSNQARDGAFRRIQVRFSMPGSTIYSVRTREGYLAPGPEEKKISVNSR